jgi:hypothetical protein
MAEVMKSVARGLHDMQAAAASIVCNIERAGQGTFPLNPRPADSERCNTDLFGRFQIH